MNLGLSLGISLGIGGSAAAAGNVPDPGFPNLLVTATGGTCGGEYSYTGDVNGRPGYSLVGALFPDNRSLRWNGINRWFFYGEDGIVELYRLSEDVATPDLGNPANWTDVGDGGTIDSITIA